MNDNNTPTWTLKLDDHDLQNVINGLRQLPIGAAAETWERVKSQVAAQQQRAHDAAADANNMPSGAPAPNRAARRSRK